MLIAIATLAAFGAVLLASLQVAGIREGRRARALEVLASHGGRRAADDPVEEAPSRPSPVDLLAGALVRPAYRARLAALLERAGEFDPAAIDRLVRRKAWFASGGIAWGMLLAAGGAPGGPALAIVFGGIGFVAPDLLAYNGSVKRDADVARTLADALDLLTMCVESGLSLQAALAQVAARQSGPVPGELARVLREMQLGKSRGEAFAALAARTRQPDLLGFATAMLQVDRLGIPVASVLREQASQMRSKRRERAREQAQKVPVKILLPVLSCFLPGLFIIVMGPAAMSMVEAFSQL